MNDGDNTGAIVTGMVTPFILLVTVFAVILVCWRWYAHHRCCIRISLISFPHRRYIKSSGSSPVVSSTTCKPMHVHEVISKAKANNSRTPRTTMKQEVPWVGFEPSIKL